VCVYIHEYILCFGYLHPLMTIVEMDIISYFSSTVVNIYFTASQFKFI